MVSDADLAADAARQAGLLLLEIRSQGTEGGAVADVQSDRLLARILAGVRPDDAVLSEEVAGTGERLRADRVWIIDPLDGTREFGEPGRSDWAVHVALWVRGELVAGAVALPALGEIWSTVPGAHPVPDLARPIARIAVSRTRPPLWAIAVAADLGAEVVPMGSAGAKAAAVLRGDVDAYLHDGGQYEWDSAAPVAVATHLGFTAARADGTALAYNQPDPYLPDLVICPPAAAEDLLARIAGHRNAARPAPVDRWADD